jgi:uncharacterized DUF497 family protein
VAGGGGRDGCQWAVYTSHEVSKEDVAALVGGAVRVFAGLIVEPDRGERRWLALGEDHSGRYLALVFTRRDELLRPISLGGLAYQTFLKMVVLEHMDEY